MISTTEPASSRILLGSTVAGRMALHQYLAARKVLCACFLVGMFLWPFELPIAMAAHGLARKSLGAWYGVLFHATALSVVSLAIVLSGRWRARWIAADWHCFAYAGLAYLAVGVAALPISSLGPFELRFSYQQLICGYLAPLLAMSAMLTLPPRIQARAWVAFFGGWTAFLLASFALLYVSWHAADAVPPSLADGGFAERLLLWRYSLGEEWNVYGMFIGNSNKMSNYLVMFLLLSVTLLKIGIDAWSPVRKWLLGVFWLCACITLVTLFSRAALLLMPLVIAFSGITAAMSKRLAVTVLMALVIGLAAISVLEPRIFQYLLAARLLEDVEANPLGTFVDRLEQWRTLLHYLGESSVQAIFGLGTSGYGMVFFGYAEAGTHNFLLDLWVESGVFGILSFGVFLALLGFLIVTARKSGRERVLLAFALLVLLMLMMREHSLAYLYVTAMGGLCVIVIAYLAMVPSVSEKQSWPRP